MDEKSSKLIDGPQTESLLISGIRNVSRLRHAGVWGLRRGAVTPFDSWPPGWPWIVTGDPLVTRGAGVATRMKPTPDPPDTIRCHLWSSDPLTPIIADPELSLGCKSTLYYYILQDWRIKKYLDIHYQSSKIKNDSPYHILCCWTRLFFLV